MEKNKPRPLGLDPPDASFLIAPVAVAFSSAFPDLELTGLSVAATEGGRWVVRAFFESELTPSPYRIFAVDKATLKTDQLEGAGAEPYWIQNYK